MKHKLCDTKKRLNALKHQTATKQKKIESLQTQYDQMMKDSADAVSTDKGESVDAQVLTGIFLSKRKYEPRKIELNDLHKLMAG